MLLYHMKAIQFLIEIVERAFSAKYDEILTQIKTVLHNTAPYRIKHVQQILFSTSSFCFLCLDEIAICTKLYERRFVCKMHPLVNRCWNCNCIQKQMKFHCRIIHSVLFWLAFFCKDETCMGVCMWLLCVVF